MEVPTRQNRSENETGYSGRPDTYCNRGVGLLGETAEGGTGMAERSGFCRPYTGVTGIKISECHDTSTRERGLPHLSQIVR
ncbi:hypothetical protein LTR53_005987 [Teratosphaeriaceae sp. CCFEE 6253]|nr:hypothetical protein LTR53_005987 [Teratosphaeriaceae sp. CCFEE 6253]